MAERLNREEGQRYKRFKITDSESDALESAIRWAQS